jgi:thiamine biosynthesis lipoprotein
MTLTPTASGFVYMFAAMASPCEIHVDAHDGGLALRLGQIAQKEALRIEAKFSRYRDDSVLSIINASGGRPTAVDEETARLLDYADQCWRLSDGLFDLTSGVLRRAWKFDASDRVPSQAQIDELLPHIGWSRVEWTRPMLTLPAGMELDLGGIGKEYAVDLVVAKVVAESRVPVLVNFGGDLRVSSPHADGARWRVAIESVADERDRDGVLEIADGALATSGDARRFLLRDGVRYSHILDPRTGWPVCDPPRSITVAAPTCLEAGILATMAMLHGRKAETFLERQGVAAWVAR